MTVILASLGTGILVGLIFSALKLTLLAPPVAAGITGIMGIFLGGKIWKMIGENFFN